MTAVELMFRNWLFGGQPGSGKTFAMRLLVLAAALDIRVELRGYELKGVGDFKALAPVCAEYGNGNDDDTLTACADMFGWLYGEGQKRAKRIAHYYHGIPLRAIPTKIGSHRAPRIGHRNSQSPGPYPGRGSSGITFPFRIAPVRMNGRRPAPRGQRPCAFGDSDVRLTATTWQAGRGARTW